MAIIIESGLAADDSGADEFISSDLITTGAIHWVDSVNGNDGYTGSESEPLATLQQAITNATTNNGDIIVLKSGHLQTVSSTITINKAGLKIFGIGEGSTAPVFTLAAATDAISVTANNVEINNLFFAASTTATNTARINVDAANCKIKGCVFRCGVYDAASATLTSNALYTEIVSCSFSVTANGPDYGIIVESASAVGLRIQECSFNGGTYNWDLGAIYSGFAHLNYMYDSNTFTGDAQVVHTAAAKGCLSNTIAGEGSTVAV